jgi:hypothetical protein
MHEVKLDCPVRQLSKSHVRPQHNFVLFYSERNVAVCKICREDDNEDWLGCDHCGQFFHASCVGVDFATALSKLFYCI